jgi:hypothetical protein
MFLQHIFTKKKDYSSKLDMYEIIKLHLKVFYKYLRWSKYSSDVLNLISDFIYQKPW